MYRKIICSTLLCVLLFLSFIFITTSSVSSSEKSNIALPSPTEKQIIIQATHTPYPPTPTPIVIAPSPTQTASYIVLPGDALQNIALKFGVDMDLLAVTNKLDDPNLIFPGQVLIIPNPQRDLSVVTPIANFNISSSNKRIQIILSEQKLYAYDGDQLLASFLISSGTATHPTVTGNFNIWIKLESTRMTGDGYDLPNVPYTMYFSGSYGIHGTYWHHNFGVPMSHGCINMKTEEAQWLYSWAQVGTPVEVIN
jgi:lipoprotein-anchoring transpeptidase ErfK/SrfK